MKKERSPEEYWASVEKELGETIRGYVLARLPDPSESGRLGMAGAGPQWGLVFLTDEALYVDRSSTPNWFQRLVQRDRGGEEEERTVIPIRAISRIDLPEQKRGLARVLAGPEIQIDIYFYPQSKPIRLMLDKRGPTDPAFIALLEELARTLDGQGEQ